METGAISTASPASQSCVRPGSPRSAGKGRKSRLFAHSTLSPDSRFAGLEVEIAESLRPCPQIFPFYEDYRRRLVRSRLPPDPALKSGQFLPPAAAELVICRLDSRAVNFQHFREATKRGPGWRVMPVAGLALAFIADATLSVDRTAARYDNAGQEVFNSSFDEIGREEGSEMVILTCRMLQFSRAPSIRRKIPSCTGASLLLSQVDDRAEAGARRFSDW